MNSRFARAVVALVTLPVVAITVMTGSAGATTPPATHKPSYAVLYTGTTPDGTTPSPCTSKGCANGFKLSWSKGECYHGDRYAPIAVIFTIAGKVSTTSWPLTAPCSTGIAFTWDNNNQLNGAAWVGASSSNEGIAACFRSKNACNSTHCATAGCLPAHTTGVDIFFQAAGDTPTAAQWTFNGKPDGAVTMYGSPDTFFWYATSPPASPYATPGVGPSSTPKATISGRNSSNHLQVVTDTAPGSANGVSMSWYLPKYDHGCHKASGTWFVSFPFAFVYTTNGQLSGRVGIAKCETSGGNPLSFSAIDFSWANTVDGIVLTTANSGNTDPAYTPQPPVGANGVILTYAHDDFHNSYWTNNGSPFATLKHPGHVRFEVLKP